MASIDTTNRLGELFGGGVLHDEAARPRIEGALDITGTAKGREHEDTSPGESRANRFTGRDAVHDGHFDIQKDHVDGVGASRARRRRISRGCDAPKDFQGFAAVTGLSAHLDVRLQ